MLTRDPGAQRMGAGLRNRAPTFAFGRRATCRGWRLVPLPLAPPFYRRPPGPSSLAQFPSISLLPSSRFPDLRGCRSFGVQPGSCRSKEPLPSLLPPGQGFLLPLPPLPAREQQRNK